MEHQTPPFFSRGPTPLVRLAFFTLLSVLLLVLDARLHYADGLRKWISVGLFPLQRAALMPTQLAARAQEFFVSQSGLRRDTVRLRDQHVRSAEALLTLDHLRSENAHLRALLSAQARLTTRSTLGEILYASRDPFSRRIVVDRGSNHGVHAGQAVIDEAGVLGQITRAYPLMSEVTLITDKELAVPVQVIGNGLRALAFGAGDGASLELRFMPANAEIQRGDVLVTSGLDGVYPAGLPVGTVQSIERGAAYAFARILCSPAAGVDRHAQVLILDLPRTLPPAPPMTRPTPPDERAKTARHAR